MRMKSGGHIWKIILVVEAVILLCKLGIGIYHANHLFSVDFNREQIAGYVAEKQVGGHVDETMGAGLYDVVPDVFLKKGSYTFSVTFDGSSAGSFVWMHNYHTKIFHAFEQSTVDLMEDEIGKQKGFFMYVDLHMTLRLSYSGSGEVNVTGLSIRETNDWRKRDFCITATLFFLLDTIPLVIKKRKEGKIQDGVFWGFAILLGAALFVSYPALTTESVLTVSDMEFHVARVESLKDGLLDGQFPVRISPDFYDGYGYANSIFYGELFLYIPALFRLLGFNLTEVINGYIILLNILTAFGSFWAFHGMFKDRGIAVGAAVLFTCAPYRLTNMYYRGALGEYTAMAFLPFVMYGFYCIYAKDTDSENYRRSYLPLLVGLTGVIQSHTLTIEMTGGAILLICVMLLPLTLQKKRFLMLLKTAGLTILVNLWFIIPFVDYYLTMDLRFKALAGKEMIQGIGIYPIQLFTVFHKHSYVNQYGGFEDDLPLSLGPALIFGLLLCIAALFEVKEIKKDQYADSDAEEHSHLHHTAIVLVLLTFAFLWMASVYFPWDKIHDKSRLFATLVSSLQFPWRILELATLTAAGAVGAGISLFKRRFGYGFAQALVVGFCVLEMIGGAYQMQVSLWNSPSWEYKDMNSFRWGTTVATVAGEFTLSKARWEIITEVDHPVAYEGAEVLDWEKSGTHVQLEVQSGENGGYITLPLQNYKGYHARSEHGLINDNNLSEGNGAVVQINLPENYRGEVRVFFASPWYWRVAECISYATILWGLFTGCVAENCGHKRR